MAAVVLAMISAIVNIGFLSAYPVYGVLMVGLDVLIIWAVTVHGGEAPGVGATCVPCVVSAPPTWPSAPSSWPPSRWPRWAIASARSSRPAVSLVRDDLARQVGAALDRLVPVAVAQVMRRIDLNELVEKYVDVERLIAGMDLATLTNQVMAEIDLPEIIRQSTGSVASETLRGVRMQAISADDVVARLGGRLRLRRPPHGRWSRRSRQRRSRRTEGTVVTAEPVSPIPKEARGYQGEPAGLVTRLLAGCIDVAVTFVVLVALWAGFNGFRFMLDPRGFTSSGTSAAGQRHRGHRRRDRRT